MTLVWKMPKSQSFVGEIATGMSALVSSHSLKPQIVHLCSKEQTKKTNELEEENKSELLAVVVSNGFKVQFFCIAELLCDVCFVRSWLLCVDDHSRVQLQRDGIDYINASLVDAPEANRSYILTQVQCLLCQTGRIHIIPIHC